MPEYAEPEKIGRKEVELEVNGLEADSESETKRAKGKKSCHIEMARCNENVLISRECTSHLGP